MAACQEYGIVRPDHTRPLPKLSGPTPPQPLYFEAIPCGTPAPHSLLSPLLSAGCLPIL